MANSRLVAFEGLPFTGKSATAAALQCEHPAVMVAPDYHELIPPTERRRMATLPESWDDQNRRLSLYRQIDDERWAQVSDSRDSIVLFDRCFVSVASYTMAISRTFDTAVPIESFGSAKWHTAEPGCRLPAEIIYFDIGLDVAVERHHRLSTTIDPRFRSREFLSHLIEAYADVLAMCGSHVVIVDGHRPLDELVKSVKEHVYGKDPT